MPKQRQMKKKAMNVQDSRTPISKEQILHEAVHLADEKGIESLSMRALGKRLGVEAMSLYNHVAGKEEMLDGMVDLVVMEIDLPDEKEDWRKAMRKRALSARDAFARHPWVSVLIDSRLGGGPGRLRYFESVIGSLRRSGFSLQLSARAFSLIDSYIYGFGRQSASLASTDANTANAAKDFLSTLPLNEYPYLREIASDHAAGPGYNEAEDFEFGLTLILDGLQRLLDSGQS
ncbi:MAG: TetR/AcrR family transcriptional regulator [Treponemataceae bacterium]